MGLGPLVRGVALVVSLGYPLIGFNQLFSMYGSFGISAAADSGRVAIAAGKHGCRFTVGRHAA